jgi:glycosyltransferase involved in cell wall biosynthesis
LAAEHSCIRVIHKENGGLSSARNAGMEVARGHYIWFIDSDDWIEPGALTLLHRTCSDGEPEMVKFSHIRVTDKAERALHNAPAGRYMGEERCNMLLPKALCETSRYCLSGCTHVYRRDFLENYQLTFVSERLVGSEDYLFNLQALFCVKHVYVLSDALYCYEMRQGSLTQTYKSDLSQRYCELHRRLTLYVCEHGRQQYLPLVDRFYLWHLLVSTCFSQEYLMVTQDHPLWQARKNVSSILRLKQVQHAARNADRTGLKWQKYFQLAAIRLQQESVFCYLYGKRR